ncbi:MAG: transporter substrate-binding domain-containing protein, partial [Gallionella sp.]|nr:transporter substrate-binding domain-containing protein [Gallionella sp.]
MKTNRTKLALAILAAGSALAIATPAQAGKTLDAVKARGELVCGVNTGLAGFSAADSQGKWSGLDVDVCRAIAAAVLGDGNKVKFVPLTAQQRFTALQSGEIDFGYFTSANILNTLESRGMETRGAGIPSFDEIGINTGSAYQTD